VDLQVYFGKNTGPTRQVRWMENMKHGEAFFTSKISLMVQDIKEVFLAAKKLD
jgi:hypothetical protein